MDNSLLSEKKDDEKEKEKNSMDVAAIEFLEIVSNDRNILKNLFVNGFDIMIIMIGILARDLIIYAFCRNYGYEIVAAITSITVIYDLFLAVIPFSLSMVLLTEGAGAL